MKKRRVLLKLSGESLCAPGGSGIDVEVARGVALQIQRGLTANELELALIVGGGNLLRGAQISGTGIDRVTGDTMGMLATVINALALKAVLESAGVPTRVLSPVATGEGVDPFSCQLCDVHLEAGRTVILAGGTGNPYFTTDTTAVLRSLQIGADVVCKGTKVRGIYSEDPETNPEAEFYERVSFKDAIQRGLRVMDVTAFSLCQDNELPIRVFNVRERGNIERVLRGEEIGTLVE